MLSVLTNACVPSPFAQQVLTPPKRGLRFSGWVMNRFPVEPGKAHGRTHWFLPSHASAFRRRALGEQSGAAQRIAARVRKSRQKEAAGAADAGLMQIEWSQGEVLKLAGVGKEPEKEFGSPGRCCGTTVLPSGA